MTNDPTIYYLRSKKLVWTHFLGHPVLDDLDMCKAMNYWRDMTQEELSDILTIWGVNYDYKNDVHIWSIVNAVILWF